PSAAPAPDEHPFGDGSPLDWEAHPENNMRSMLDFATFIPQVKSSLGTRYGEVWLTDAGTSNVACIGIVGATPADLATVRALTVGPRWRIGVVAVGYSTAQLVSYRDAIV